MTKAVYDKNVPTRNLVTTILGILGLVASILVGFGVVTPEQSTELTTQGTTIINAGFAIYTAVLSLISIFKATDA